MISVDLVVYGRDESPIKFAIVAEKILHLAFRIASKSPEKCGQSSCFNYDWSVAKMNELLRKPSTFWHLLSVGSLACSP